MEEILANISPHIEYDSASDDDIYWDNLRITVRRCDRDRNGAAGDGGEERVPLCNEHDDDDD